MPFWLPVGLDSGTESGAEAGAEAEAEAVMTMPEEKGNILQLQRLGWKAAIDLLLLILARLASGQKEGTATNTDGDDAGNDRVPGSTCRSNRAS